MTTRARGKAITPLDHSRPQGSARTPRGAANAGALPHAFVEEVRHAVNIAQVVGEHVSLKRAGRTLKGLCPFHAEKTPSFHVDEAKGFFHCFGCSAGGDVFAFVMRQESMTFPETLRLLAEKAGVQVPERSAPTEADAMRERVLALNHAAQQAFVEQMGSHGAKEALAYLSRRGIGSDIVASFGLGWAPDSWDFLSSSLAGRFEARELTASGLVVARPTGSGVYDRFRARVTFPIRAVSERVVGFGGRLIAAGEPKYLNSPETPVYTKGRHLFGLDRAKSSLHRSGRAILVEGYLDVISLHAHGITEAVAVLGTALTPEQARLLARHAKQVVLHFDGDEAGHRATRRSIELLVAEGLDVRVLELPAGSDPDDRVRSIGGEAHAKALDEAPGFFEYLLRIARKEHDTSSPTGRLAAFNDLLPLVTTVQDRFLREQLEDAACDGLGIKPGLVRDAVRRAVKKGLPVVDVPAQPPEVSHAESALITWLITDDRAREAFREMAGDVVAALPKAAIFQAILDQPRGALRVESVVDGLTEEWQRQLVGRCAVDQHHEPLDFGAVREKVSSFLAELGVSPSHDARRRKHEVVQLLKDALGRNDRVEAARLMSEAHELARTIHR